MTASPPRLHPPPHHPGKGRTHKLYPLVDHDHPTVTGQSRDHSTVTGHVIDSLLDDPSHVRAKRKPRERRETRQRFS